MKLERGKNERTRIRYSVRELVEFLRQTGDIDDRISAGTETELMQKGAKIHRKLQASMGLAYQSEVPFSYTLELPLYDLCIEGRADGVITQHDKETPVTIDEIKGISRPVGDLDAPVTVHRAQAMCYAYMLAQRDGLSSVGIRMTYVDLDSEEVRLFEEVIDAEKLAAWFEALITDLRQFTDWMIQWLDRRDSSMEDLSFPFPYREGQEALVRSVWQTIRHEKHLYLNAPTGVGKTMAVVYPSVRAIGGGLASRIFYLTERNAGSTVAEEAFSILRGAGLLFKTVSLTAKEKACFLHAPMCNPEACPYAKEYFGKLPAALYELLLTDSWEPASIRKIATDHEVCPYYLARDAAAFADGIIADVNYVFDPDVRLAFFFGPGTGKEHIFLIDEAHNLPARAREMYSASLVKEDILAAGRLVKDYPRAKKALAKINRRLLALKKESEKTRVIPPLDILYPDVQNALYALDGVLEESRDAQLKEELLEHYFTLRTWLNTADVYDEHYLTYTGTVDERYFVRQFCIDPSERIRENLVTAKSAVFFSATLLPIRYYRSLLGAEEEDYSVYAPSPFDRSHRKILVASDVSAKYTRRGEEEYAKIARYLMLMASAHPGNYMAFFPSYKMMRDVFDVYRKLFDREDTDWVVQPRYMGEEDREIFLENFEGTQARSMLGFCVMGGAFSEAIDLVGDRLIGAAVIGTGLPQISEEGEILKEGYEEIGYNGFDYAYRFPGMNKVLQAAGRVIRTEEDLGVILLLDERFLQRSYAPLFPREWETREICTLSDTEKRLRSFWEEHSR